MASNDAGVARGRDRSFVTLRNPQGITASASPNPAPWSGSTTVSGKVSGQGVGGTTVALERQDFPFGGPFYLVATKAAASNGSFSFKVGPLWAMARLRLTTRTTIVAASPIVEVRNALRVGLRARRISGGRVRLQGAVSPAVPNGRATLQKRSPSGRWVPLRRAGVHPLAGARSRYRSPCGAAAATASSCCRATTSRTCAARAARSRCAAELQRPQQAVAGLGALDRRAHAGAVAQRAAGGDDDPVALEAAGQLAAVDPLRAQPQHVGLAGRDVQPEVAHGGGQPRALGGHHRRAARHHAAGVAQRLQRAGLGELVEPELGLELLEQRLGARARRSRSRTRRPARPQALEKVRKTSRRGNSSTSASAASRSSASTKSRSASSSSTTTRSGSALEQRAQLVDARRARPSGRWGCTGRRAACAR